MSQFFGFDLFGFEDTSLFQVFEQPLPFHSSPGEFYSTFSPEAQLDISSFHAILEPSSSQPQATAIPLDNDVRNNDVCDEGLWAAGNTHSSAIVPALPPVRFTQSVSSNIFSFRKNSRFHRRPRPQSSHITGSRYHKGITITEANNGVSNHWNLFISRWVVAPA